MTTTLSKPTEQPGASAVMSKRKSATVATGKNKPGCASVNRSAYPWQDAYDALCQCLEEDAEAIEKIVADEDSCCAARELRRERAATLRYALALADTLKRWDWG